ncbi:hypothetical protein [Microbacterium sp. NPDC055665]
MAPVERKSALAKAPTIDVVEALTAPAPAVETPAALEQRETSSSPAAQRDTEASSSVVPNTQREAKPKGEISPSSVRRGPGRPRSRRRMEPLSTKIDIELRDEVDAYLLQHDMTFVDLLDEALRAKLAEFSGDR